jgi:hypothetical protein
VITLDIHHITHISKGGKGTADNLIALCPNCHTLHHKGVITEESILAWKFLLLALNEAFDRRSIDTLLALDELGGVMLWGDGVLGCASLIASGLVSVVPKDEPLTGKKLPDQLGLPPPLEDGESIEVREFSILDLIEDKEPYQVFRVAKYWAKLSDKGQAFVNAWKQGNQAAAIAVSSLARRREAK